MDEIKISTNKKIEFKINKEYFRKRFQEILDEKWTFEDPCYKNDLIKDLMSCF